MKQFLKYTLATIIGILVVSFVFFFLGFGVLGALLATSSSPLTLKPNSVYRIDLEGNLVDRSEDDSFERAFGEVYGQPVLNMGLDDLLANIRKAKEHPDIAGIYLNGGSLLGGYASMKELRDALLDFKASGKFVVAYADAYTQANYYLVSVADKIFLNPIGMLGWQGISAQVPFYKNMLDKLGIEMQIIRVGSFKSAVEPFSNTEMSEANRNQITAYVHSFWNEILNSVSESRGISTEKLNAYADEMMTFQASEKNWSYGLVDSLLYADQAEKFIENYLPGKEKVNFVKHSEMSRVNEGIHHEKEKVAVIYALGGIDTDAKGGIISKNLVEEINKVAKDESIKAVVLRVNSPGGSAYGSEQIWHALEELKEKKPFFVSMGNYAASGGYYIACGADSIFAQPNTITGSIGVFGMIPNIEGLRKKIGIGFDGVKTNKMSEGININRSFSPEERDLMQGFVNRAYELFVSRCAEGRGKSVESIKAIAEGRVWTGEAAVGNGLIDGLANLNQTIALAAEKAGLQAYRVVEFPAKEDFMTRLMKNFDVESRILKSHLGEYYDTYRNIRNFKHLNGIQALLPYEIIVN